MTPEEWLNNNKLSIDILTKKYLDDGELLDQWFDRISGMSEISYSSIKTELTYSEYLEECKELRQQIIDKKFIFGGRILANRGLQNKRKVTFSNCYVIAPPEDNLESIFDTNKETGKTFSYGGGCGNDLSNLRPRDAEVHNAAKTTCGPVGFMDLFSQTTATIGQDGRRGALMLSLDVRHPDIEEFIDCKTDLNRVNYANISVRVNDEFMRAVENDSDYLLHWPYDMDISEKEIEAIDEYDKLIPVETASGPVYLKKVKAKRLFMKLAENNWRTAEPGILYWDRISNYNLLSEDPNFEYAGVNPCAEEPLPAYGSCLLGSINLSAFVIDPFTKDAYVDTEELIKTVTIAVKALNNVLDEGLTLHPLKKQQETVKDWRQIGLGIMGLADMFIKLGVKYGSQESIWITDDIMKIISRQAIIVSSELAGLYGSYPKFNKEYVLKSKFISDNQLIKHNIEQFGLRNSQLLTCAPTGSIGTMFQISTGVEPNYAFEFERKTISLNNKETKYKVYAPIVEEYKQITGNKTLPDYFVTSVDINSEDRIKVQATLQKYIDASISSTINLPEETTIEQVAEIYMNAWKNGLKGVTIWRDKCERDAILSTGNNDRSEEHTPLKRGEIVKVNDNCIGLKRTLVTGCGTLHCEAFFDPKTGELLETYLSKGSKGGCNNYMIGLSRMISLAARGGLGIDAIIDQLKSCGTCPSYAVRTATQKDTSLGSCCPVAVANALKDMSIAIKHQIECCEPINQDEISPTTNPSDAECPNCHHKTLVHTNGCISCPDCGWTKCD